MSEGALSGLVVLDLSEGVAGPFCTRLLSDYGAQVLKVERPGVGDCSRAVGPFPGDQPHPERSGLFLLLNAGKEGITLDVEGERGAEILRELSASADIVVEDLPPGVVARLGLDYQALAAVDPSLIWASISYFGQSGPYREWQGSALVAQAVGGLMAITGEAGREPLRLPGPQAEFQAGLNAAVAILCALHFRDESGQGQHIDVSVQEAVASILESSVLAYGYSGFRRGRLGPRHPLQCPSLLMPARDGLVYVQAGAEWDHFATFLQAPELVEPRLSSPLRYRYADEVEGAIAPRLAERDARELFTAAQEWRIPFALVLGIDELFQDPQYQARGFFRQVEHPAAGTLTYPGAPFRMGETPAEVCRAPLLGEHNEEVYVGRLGMAREEVERLCRAGTV